MLARLDEVQVPVIAADVAIQAIEAIFHPFAVQDQLSLKDQRPKNNNFLLFVRDHFVTCHFAQTSTYMIYHWVCRGVFEQNY